MVSLKQLPVALAFVYLMPCSFGLADDPKDPSEKVPPSGVVGKTKKVIRVFGAKNQKTFKCDGEEVAVAGAFNTVTLKGKCKKITIGGTGNVVIAEDVELIAITGSKNVVKYLRGPKGKEPRIVKAGVDNEVIKLKPKRKTDEATDK